MAELRKDLRQRGMVSKRRVRKNGASSGGANFTWYPLNAILTNPLYAGMIRHKQALYTGQHEAIIDPGLFAEVQSLVGEITGGDKAREVLAYPSLLNGIAPPEPDNRLLREISRAIR